MHRDPGRPGRGEGTRRRRQGVRPHALPDAAVAPRLARPLQPAARERHVGRRPVRRRRRLGSPPAAIPPGVGGAQRRLIVVSNRGPVTYDRDEQGVRVARRGGGGLVTALRSLAAREDVSWIASAISDEDRIVAAEGGAADGLRLLAHDAAAYDLFYNVVAHPLLWFVQHELWDPARPPAAFGRLEQGWRDGYTVVNQAFADAVCEELETHPDAVVFFQDYHLYLAPRLVRERFPDAVLAHFVHIPWAEPAGWNVLPEPIRIAVHDGLLANDLVGFHTERWLRRFTASAREILGAEPADGRTLCVARPISVDPAEYLRLAGDPEVLDRQRRLAAGRPERLLLRVERTDPSKNVVLGLRAFERYLDTHLEAAGRVGLLALLDPSRLEIPEYAAYLEEIRRTVAEINERLGDGRRTPIDLRVEDDFPGSVAAYKEYDVL